MDGVRLDRYFVDQGVKGVYVGGSSGECIYQSVEDRKKTLEAVMDERGPSHGHRSCCLQ